MRTISNESRSIFEYTLYVDNYFFPLRSDHRRISDNVHIWIMPIDNKHPVYASLCPFFTVPYIRYLCKSQESGRANRFSLCFFLLSSRNRMHLVVRYVVVERRSRARLTTLWPLSSWITRREWEDRSGASTVPVFLHVGPLFIFFSFPTRKWFMNERHTFACVHPCTYLYKYI